MWFMMVVCFFSPEYTEIKPEHIECSKSRYSIFNGKKKFVLMKSSSKYFILAEKT